MFALDDFRRGEDSQNESRCVHVRVWCRSMCCIDCRWGVLSLLTTSAGLTPRPPYGSPRARDKSRGQNQDSYFLGALLFMSMRTLFVTTVLVATRKVAHECILDTVTLASEIQTLSRTCMLLLCKQLTVYWHGMRCVEKMYVSSAPHAQPPPPQMPSAGLHHCF